jgi:hypothetical protein
MDLILISIQPNKWDKLVEKAERKPTTNKVEMLKMFFGKHSIK